MRHLLKLWILCLFLGVLASCGGGGGGGGGGGTTPPPVALTIASITPVSAAPGATLTVSGTGFTRVTGARVGSADASFTVQSDTAMSVIVPNSANSGALELTGTGVAVQSSQTITVEVPAVTSIEPASVVPGGRITFKGSFLNLVSSARIGTVTLAIVSKAADQLVVDVPANALSGFPVLVNATGVERQSTVGVTVLQPLTVSAITPSAGIVGSTLTLTGTGLDQVEQVFFGSAAATPATRQATQLTVLVPAGASTGAPRLTAPGISVTLSQTYRVAPTIIVSSMSPNTGAVGTTVTVNGSGLDEVSGVTVAGIAATIGTRSATELRFTVPSGVTTGAVLLLSSSQASVTAGSFSTQPIPTLARIDFAQTFSQQANDTYQRLVPGKPAVVRAYVIGPGSTPGVTLVVRNGSNVIASLPMSGPSTLPTSQQPYSLSQTFNATLTGAQVVSGLNVTVQLSAPGGSLNASPVIGNATNLKLTLVPLRAGSNTAQMPTADTVRSSLLRVMPLSDTSTEITTRATHTLTSVTAPPVNSDEWSDILSELDTLREAEAGTRHYYGFVPRPTLSGAQTVGLGYLNSLNSSNTTAIGLDTRYGDWRETLLHEMGHNFSLSHAPCGGPSDADSAYPYSNGVLGTAGLYDSTTGLLSNPSGETDLMGYCDGTWLSDYHYRNAQRWLESNRYPQIMGVPEETDLLVISGHVRDGVVRFVAPHARRGQPLLAGTGTHVLRITFKDGSTRDYPVRARPVPDARSVGFHIAIAHPGEVSRLDLLQDGKLLSQAARPQARVVGAANRAPRVNWREANGQLLLDWDATAYPNLSVTLVGRERQVLAMGLQGGQASLPLDQGIAGGMLEFSFANGLDTRLLRARR